MSPERDGSTRSRRLSPSRVPGFGLGWPRSNHVATALRLWRHPGLDASAIRSFQRRCLRRLLRHAGQRIPYYRDVFSRAGVDVDDLADVEDVLRRLPPLNRMDLIREPRERLLRPGADPSRLVEERSSGSTGSKLFLWRDPFEAHLLQLFRWRCWREMGLRPADRLTLLRGTFSETRSPLPITRLRQRLGLFQTEEISPQQPPEDVLVALHRSRPDALFGYPSVLNELARRLQEPARHELRPRVVSSGGEMVSAQMRERIETAFGVPLIDTYGAMEFNLLATQCPVSERMHVLDDAVRIELLANGEAVGEGEVGEVVATGLHSYTFPLIRYRLGDLAVRGPSPCPCGAPFSTLERLRGRTVEYFYATDGRPVHHWTVTQVVHEPIRNKRFQYQMVQTAADHIVLRIVPLREITEDERAEVLRLAAEMFGEDLRFELELVDELACAPSGKMVQSRNDYRSPWIGNRWDPADWDRWRPGC